MLLQKNEKYKIFQTFDLVEFDGGQCSINHNRMYILQKMGVELGYCFHRVDKGFCSNQLKEDLEDYFVCGQYQRDIRDIVLTQDVDKCISKLFDIGENTPELFTREQWFFNVARSLDGCGILDVKKGDNDGTK